MKYSIVFPCYNESGSIKKLFTILQKIPQKYDAEFILVENGSTDNSRKIFQKLPKTNNIKLIYIDKNQGYGYGIIRGLKSASGEYIGWLHSDLQYNPLDLIPFFEYINNHPKTNVLLKGKRKNRKIIEHLFTFGMGVYDTILFRKKMTNVMAMPVIFNRSLIFNKKTEISPCLPTDYSIDIYIYALANKLNYKVVHLPIKLQERHSGTSSWNTSFSAKFKQSVKMINGSKKIKKSLEDK